LTPVGRNGRLAAMHKIGDLFSDMGMLLFIFDQEETDGVLYWICDDLSGKSSGPLWYRDEYVTEGKQELLDRLKEQ